MKIKKCRSCYSRKLIKIISLGNHYLSDFLNNNKKPKSFPLRIVLCKNCTLLQLDYTTPTKYLYTERYGYKSGINQTMKNELKEIAIKSLSKIKKYKRKIVVVDIGSNDGTLIKNYPENIYKIAIEPIKKYAIESKTVSDLVINEFFSYNSYKKNAKGLKADVITAISCFYDIDNPNKFISDIKKILDINGVFVIQQNYVVEMLKQNAFDNIVHEHLEYYSLKSLNNLLLRHEMEIFDLELSQLNGGSFRTYITFRGKRKITKAVSALARKEQKLFFKKPRKNQHKIRIIFSCLLF